MWLHQEQTRGKHTINISTFHQDNLPTTLILHICSVHVQWAVNHSKSCTCLFICCLRVRSHAYQLVSSLHGAREGVLGLSNSCNTIATFFIPSLVSLHHYYVRKSHWLVYVTQYLASHKEPLSYPILQTDQEVRRHKVVWHPTSGYLSTLIRHSICMCT